MRMLPDMATSGGDTPPHKCIWGEAVQFSALTFVPAIFLEAWRALMGASFLPAELAARWAWVVALCLVGRQMQRITRMNTQSCGRTGIFALGIGVLATVAYLVTRSEWAAWALLTCLYAVFLFLDQILIGPRLSWIALCGHAIFALVAGAFAVLIGELESHFADEEFFAALQVAALGAFGFLLIVAQILGGRRKRALPILPAHARVRLGAALASVALAGAFWALRAYQRSFYTPQAPTYPAISPATPFISARVPPDPQTFEGEAVLRALLAHLEANPYKSTPEYGMLALLSGEPAWADTFKRQLLHEAQQGLFTGPAHSVKFGQYEAALRLYYYTRLKRASPNLFSAEESRTLREWFEAINRRAMTVEWVDWMYAAAFNTWPEGPYENQENGAGLLALLEAEGLADAQRSARNRDYLARNVRGWAVRFRNSDDALVYQPEWINNALFQSLYTGQAHAERRRLAFEWLLLQALPDGSFPMYNHPGSVSLAGTGYLGAALLGDGRYVWLAGRALEGWTPERGYLFAQPGIESATALQGRSPEQGSALLYGESGLPTQVGPLAPDKIVFRDGWARDATYMLLNLRFTGWHRYKATNTVVLLSKQGPLVVEERDGKPFAWLPTGRSLFRDKRIPRENLNGLLIPRSGMSATLYRLTGMGSPWAQDPPHYARVAQFVSRTGYDYSRTVIENWRGWQHERQVHFYHDGPIVIVDRARGPNRQHAALAWHVARARPLQEGRLPLRTEPHPAEMLVLSLDGSHARITEAAPEDDLARVGLVCHSARGGELGLVTVFLMERWVGAQVELETERASIRITQGSSSLTIPLTHVSED